MKKINFGISKFYSEGIAIDVSTHTLRLLHLKRYVDKKEIQNLRIQNTTSLNDEEIFKIIDSFLVEIRAKKLSIVGVIPSYLVITKNIEIPSVNPQEIREIVNLQATRHTPYSHEEIMVNYIDLGSFKRNYTQILLIIVPQQIIKRSFALIERTGFSLDKLCFSPEVLAYSLSELLNIDTQSFVTNMIHLDDISTDFLVVFKNIPFFIRSIPVGTVALTGKEREKATERFIEEIKKSIELYQSENLVGMPQQYILTGAIEGLEFLSKELSEVLGLPFKSIGYFKGITLSKQAETNFILNKNVSLLSLIGSVMTKDLTKVEFILEEIRLRRIIEEKTKDFLRTAIYVLAFLILLFLNLMTKIHSQTSYLTLLNKKYESLAKESEELSKSYSRLLLLKKYFSRKNYPLDVLLELYKTIPENVEIVEIRFDTESKFVLRGKSETMSGVFSFVESLNKSDYLKEAKTKYTTRRKEVNTEVIEFEINANLKL